MLIIWEAGFPEMGHCVQLELIGNIPSVATKGSSLLQFPIVNVSVIPHSCGKRNEDLGAWQKCGIPVPPGPTEPQVLQAVLVHNKDSETWA